MQSSQSPVQTGLLRAGAEPDSSPRGIPRLINSALLKLDKRKWQDQAGERLTGTAAMVPPSQAGNTRRHHGLQIRARSRYSAGIRVVLAGDKKCQHPVRSQALRTLPRLGLTAPFQASLAHRGARGRLPHEQIPRHNLDIPWRARRDGERRRVGLCDLRALGCA